MKLATARRFQPRLETLEERCTPSAATVRPISEFLNAQGTTSVFDRGVTGLPDVVGWASSSDTIAAGEGLFALVDYTGQEGAFLTANYGLADLGTTTSGAMIERVLPNGQAEVTVNLLTHNAFAFAQEIGTGYPFGTVLFGYTQDQLAADPSLTPPLADSHLQLVYIAAPGATPPDIVNAFILGGQTGYDLVSLSFRAVAHGATPSGEQATLVISQTGLLFRTPNLIRDFGFTAEVISVHTNNGGGSLGAAAQPAASVVAAPSDWARSLWDAILATSRNSQGGWSIYTISDDALAAMLDDPLGWRI